MTKEQEKNRKEANDNAAAWMVARAAGVTSRDVTAYIAGFDEGYRIAMEHVKAEMELA